MLYYKFNKPQGCVTARSDKIHKTVIDYFPSELAEKLPPVGRLHLDTSLKEDEFRSLTSEETELI